MGGSIVYLARSLATFVSSSQLQFSGRLLLCNWQPIDLLLLSLTEQNRCLYPMKTDLATEKTNSDRGRYLAVGELPIIP